MTALLATTAVMLWLRMVVLPARGSTLCPEGCKCDIRHEVEYQVSCRGPSITTVPSISLTNVKVFLLFRNNITLIERDSFILMAGLKALTIDGCGVRTIELGAFNGLTGLRDLFITGNEISELTSGTFGNLSNLKTLYLNNNGLEHLDSDVFSGLDNLIYIHLKQNNLQYLHPDTFLGLPNIRSVQLNVNPSLQIPSNRSFINSLSLSELYISHCNISSLSFETFANVSGLIMLQLMGNNLRNIEIDILKALPKLSQLYLYGNPLHCDCKLKEVWRLCVDRNIWTGYSSPTCDTPIDVKGGWWDVFKDMECLNDNIEHNGDCSSTNCSYTDTDVTNTVTQTDAYTDTQTDTYMVARTDMYTDTQSDTTHEHRENGKVSSSLTNYKVAIYAVSLIFYFKGLV